MWTIALKSTTKKTMRQDEDMRLWLSYRAGDTKALGDIAQIYYRTLLRYGLKFGVDQQVVEDCIQEIFLELWQNRERIGITPSVKNYLLKALRNNITQYYRYQQRFTTGEESGWTWSAPSQWNIELDMIEKENVSELIGQIQEQLAQLPVREREALYLRYYENLSVAEISGIMGVNRQSVSNFLQKALLKLRTKWKVAMLLVTLWSEVSATILVLLLAF